MTLDNDTVTVEEIGGDKMTITSYNYDKDREFFIAKLEKKLIPGRNYSIKIHFVANLNDNLKGFYRSKFKDKKTGAEEYIAVTQFQPTDARRAFPCFDEPQLKAKYEVSLGRRKDMSSISNMPITELGRPMDGTEEYVWDDYQESVKMST